MPAYIINGGSATVIPGLTSDQLATVLFERVTTGLPAGVTQKSSGGVIQWVKLAAPALSDGQLPIYVNPGTVSEIGSSG